MKRQDQHREAEIAATLDTARFIDRAEDLYGYKDFICDTRVPSARWWTRSTPPTR